MGDIKPDLRYEVLKPEVSKIQLSFFELKNNKRERIFYREYTKEAAVALDNEIQYTDVMSTKSDIFSPTNYIEGDSISVFFVTQASVVYVYRKVGESLLVDRILEILQRQK